MLGEWALTPETLYLAQSPTIPLTALGRVRNILGGAAGNFVEWFDWFAYVAFAIYFSGAIFPGGDQTSQLLATYLPFTLGFLARPVGAYIMGVYADSAGRKAALTLSVFMMCAASLAMGLMPTHAQAGVWAPIILTIARITQGLSVGGEYGASATYVSEMSTRKHRGFWSGFLYVTVIAGQLSAVLVLILLQNVLTDGQLHAWGWRIPFIIGAALAVIVFWIRRRLHETQSFESTSPVERGKNMMLFTKYPRETLIIFLITAGGGTAFYFYTTYMKDFLVNSAAGPTGSGFSKEQAALITTALLISFMVMQPIIGWLSDRIGRKVTLVASFGLGAVVAYPALSMIMRATTASEVVLWSALPLLALSGYTSISAIVKAELFPAHVRALGVAVPYAIAQALFGGNVASIALVLKKSGHETVTFIVIAALLGIGLVTALAMRDSKKHSMILED
ncbi:MAG: alpha-ketoglutarate permease [Acidimicrobiales bacterium]|nr:alpha-ketoglutarate permease [Acidimicrobiales bacterium]